MPRKPLLIVEGDPLVRSTIEEILKDDGWPTRTVVTGETAIRELEAGDVGALLTSVMLSGVMDGMTLAWTVRGRWPTLPIVVMSGRVRALDLPPRAVLLRKPFSLEDLLRVVAGLH
jgi:two-component system, response regulator PdtaR